MGRTVTVSSNLIRWGGLAAMGGGVLWMVVFTLFTLRPSGPGVAPPYRSFEGLYLPNLVSVVLIAAGIVALHATMRSLYGRLGTAGFVLALVGAAVLVISGASWPWELIGAIAVLLGSLLMGGAVLVANAPLRWGAIALVVGSLVFFLYNTETARAWAALPYGAAWVVVGYLLWSGGGEVPQQRPARVR
jgi:hypothetical protein